MKYVNFSNVEALIFEDRELQNLLPPHMFNYFEQWRMAKRIPVLKQMGRHAILDFLNENTDNIIPVLEEYFNDRVVIEKLSYRIVENITIPINESTTAVCNKLCMLEGFNHYCTWRDETHVYISIWR